METHLQPQWLAASCFHPEWFNASKNCFRTTSHHITSVLQKKNAWMNTHFSHRANRSTDDAVATSLRAAPSHLEQRGGLWLRTDALCGLSLADITQTAGVLLQLLHSVHEHKLPMCVVHQLHLSREEGAPEGHSHGPGSPPLPPCPHWTTCTVLALFRRYRSIKI